MRLKNLRPIFWKLPDVYAFARIGARYTSAILALDSLILTTLALAVTAGRRPFTFQHNGRKALMMGIVLVFGLTILAIACHGLTVLELWHELKFWRRGLLRHTEYQNERGSIERMGLAQGSQLSSRRRPSVYTDTDFLLSWQARW